MYTDRVALLEKTYSYGINKVAKSKKAKANLLNKVLELHFALEQKHKASEINKMISDCSELGTIEGNKSKFAQWLLGLDSDGLLRNQPKPTPQKRIKLSYEVDVK